jgi:hypothetical protein
MVRATLAACLLVACGQTGPILALTIESEGGGGGDGGSGEGGGEDASADATGDSAVGIPEASPESSAPPIAIVLVDVTSPSHADDPQLEARLGTLGFNVQERAYTSAVGPTDNAALVVVSSSAESAGLDANLAAQPIPMVVLESFAFTRLGMTGPVQDQDFGVADETSLDVVDAALSGLPLGSITVYTQAETANFAQPAAAALVAARLPGTNQAATFGYPAGTMMASQLAPARRVGVFLRTGVINEATPEGWVLFDNMVRWAVQ